VELALVLSPAFADRSSGRDRCSAVPAVPAVAERGGVIRIIHRTSERSFPPPSDPPGAQSHPEGRLKDRSLALDGGTERTVEK
jgi:hypothetical protein